MCRPRSLRIRPRHALTGLFAAAALFAATAGTHGEGVAVHDPKPAATPLNLTLESAKQMALDRQPAILAARASLNGSVTQQNTADAPMAVLSGPQIRIRRQQAAIGVSIASANIAQIEMETVNAVTRTYLSVMFAREQLKIAEGAEAEFEVLYKTAKELVDKGSKDVTAADRDRINIYRLLAQTKVSTARMRHGQAQAALREAIGLPVSQPIAIDNMTLEDYYKEVTGFLAKSGGIDCERAVQKAVQFRPEITQAVLFSELARLEIDAQGLTLKSRASTFAATGDIHSRILPPSMNDETYRPGPVGPEYPVELAGTHSQRKARAMDLYDRANQVADKVKGLIALEVEAACIGMVEQDKQIQTLNTAIFGNKETDEKKKIKGTADLAKEARDAFKNDLIKTEVMLGAQLMDAQTRAQLNEAYYMYSVWLAKLHRATNGHQWECTGK